MRERLDPPLVLDATASPAREIPRELLGGGGSAGGDFIPFGPGARACDEALRWLTASDRLTSDQVARALIEVKESRLHEREGHARWSTYLRAFVPLTDRWCQAEMWRVRKLRDFPLLSAAWKEGVIGKSHLRVILRVVRPETEARWCDLGKSSSVLELEGMAAAEKAAPPSEPQHDDPAPRRRLVMAPPGVALMVGQAVDLARKVAGYQVSTGEAVSMMAMELISGLSAADGPEPEAEADSRRPAGGEAPRTSFLGDHEALAREMGRNWEEAHRQFQEITGYWSHLSQDPANVSFTNAPADDADPHERVVFWSAAQGRLDAVRGRLLRVIQDWLYAGDLKFAGLGQYARERMGLSFREAEDLYRLDRALDGYPCAFRMYAAGELGRRKAWQILKVATPETERAWTRFAMTRTLRLLEVVVEGAMLRRETDPKGWAATGGLPPDEVSFGAATRACSVLADSGVTAGKLEPTARIRFSMDTEQRLTYEQALASLRAREGRFKPESWCLAVMARHFLDVYEDQERRNDLQRRILRRDNWTCAAPECLQRGGLECDHVKLRSRGGGNEEFNLVSLCAADHRFTKHIAGTLELSGRAPGDLSIRMGSRVYINDTLVSPAFDEAGLDSDPWEGVTAPGEEGTMVNA